MMSRVKMLSEQEISDHNRNVTPHQAIRTSFKISNQQPKPLKACHGKIHCCNRLPVTCIHSWAKVTDINEGLHLNNQRWVPPLFFPAFNVVAA